jgi:hypothetical protein
VKRPHTFDESFLPRGQRFDRGHALVQASKPFHKAIPYIARAGERLPPGTLLTARLSP